MPDTELDLRQEGTKNGRGLFEQPRLKPLERKRLIVVALAALLNCSFAVGVESIVMPLWVTSEMGFTAAEWAHMRSLRWIGVLIGVILLAPLSDRFGQRLFGALSMFGAAAALLIIAWTPRESIWIAMPFFGALVSTSYVNLNVLTQQISEHRQGMANGIYRCMGAAAAIAAPIAATSLAASFGAYTPVVFVFTAVLIVGAVILLMYPGESVPQPVGSLRGEIRRMFSTYREAFGERELMRFVHVSQIWSITLSGVGAFAAIRITQELHQTAGYYGMLSSIAGVLTLILTLASTLLLDRISIRKMCGTIAVTASICAVLMGIGDSVLLTTIGFLLFAPVSFIMIAPVSIWVSRAATTCTQSAAFSLHKVICAVYLAVGMALLGILEQRLGMREVILYGGLLGVPASVLFFLLPEPERPK